MSKARFRKWLILFILIRRTPYMSVYTKYTPNGAWLFFGSTSFGVYTKHTPNEVWLFVAACFILNTI